ncbi:MAG: hydrolase protein, partial [Acidobacteriota bacterium]|nr:hydrolase protein [Acidobacteriota bacterium]
AAWPYIFFSNLSGIPASGAPTPQEVDENGYNCPEPLYVALNLTGTQPFERPVVDADIFKIKNGTLLRVATYDQDILIRPEENQALYIYLTGDQDASGVTVLNGDETVHDLHLSDPEFLIDSISAD